MEELIKKAQHGDKEAFTEIIKSIRDDLYKIAKTRITNESDIEDAIQETMIEVYKSIKKLRDIEKFKKWTIKILVNKCNKIYRKKYKSEVSIDEYNLDNYIIVNANKDIEADLNFYDLIKDLKYKERIVLILYYLEDYPVKEIKEILGMNERTINTHLHRARKKIKETKFKGGIHYESFR